VIRNCPSERVGNGVSTYDAAREQSSLEDAEQEADESERVPARDEAGEQLDEACRVSSGNATVIVPNAMVAEGNQIRGGMWKRLNRTARSASAAASETNSWRGSLRHVRRVLKARRTEDDVADLRPPLARVRKRSNARRICFCQRDRGSRDAHAGHDRVALAHAEAERRLGAIETRGGQVGPVNERHAVHSTGQRARQAASAH